MAEQPDKRCPHKDCRFHSTRIDNEHLGDCHYMTVTGHSKLGQMTEEQRQQYREGKIVCPMYNPGPQARRNNSDLFPKTPAMPLKPLHVRCVKVRYHNVDTEPRMNLYRQGYNDYEIGRMLGLSPTAIQQWRKYERLPANCGVGNPQWGRKDKNGEA